MFIIPLIIIVSLIIILAWMYAIIPQKHDEREGVEGTPFVSVLVAVRDEEQTIERCLRALVNLNYPKHDHKSISCVTTIT